MYDKVLMIRGRVWEQFVDVPTAEPKAPSPSPDLLRLTFASAKQPLKQIMEQKKLKFYQAPNGPIHGSQAILPDDIRASLRGLGMRVRKSVAEGYKTKSPGQEKPEPANQVKDGGQTDSKKRTRDE